jgi:putative ABC transport system permease protein
MATFAADIRYATRMLRSNPGFTAVAVAALALGIGANTAIFTVVNSVLLEPLPYPQAERIMQVGRSFGGDGTGWSNSIPKYMTWRQNQAFESMTLFGLDGPGVAFGSGDHPPQVKTLHASDGYFRVFGVAPLLGRTYTSAEDVPDGPPVAVISYGLWQSQLAGESNVLGTVIKLNGQPYTVIGVLPKWFQSDPPSDVWLPQQADPNSTNQGHYLRIAGRLKPGVTVEQARAEMKVVGERFRAANPKWMDKNESVAVVPMGEAMVGPAVRTALLVLLGAVMFVLLIACANVANLLLARAAVRQRELAIRAAMGAGRWRVVRQLLTESVMLAGAGGMLGFALGAWGVRGLLLLAPGNIPRITDADGLHTGIPLLDWRVAAFTMAIALATGILFGIFPALQISNPDLASTLKEASNRSGTSRRQNRARSVLVISEIALAVVLLTGAALLIRTFMGLRSVNPGFDPHNILTLQTSMSGGTYATTAKVDALVTEVTRRLESLPGVEAAASAVMLPVQGGVDLPFTIAGKAPSKGNLYNGDEQWRSISPHYLGVFHIPVLRGRGFRETDTGNSARVVLINEAMAKRYWPKEDPVGQVITIGKGLGPQFDDPPRQVIGVVGTVRETGLGSENESVMYVPQSQSPEGITALVNSALPLSWAVRTAAPPSSLRAAIEREFGSVDRMLPLSHERNMEDVIAESLARQNFNMMLLSIFAGIALVLAAIGVYGLMSYSVEQRTQEIGIRMALGAARYDMMGMVLKTGMRLVVLGVILGVGLAYGLTRVLASLLFGVKANDPLTFALVPAILAAVALAATLIPARRAATIAPSQALRYS